MSLLLMVCVVVIVAAVVVAVAVVAVVVIVVDAVAVVVVRAGAQCEMEPRAGVIQHAGREHADRAPRWGHRGTQIFQRWTPRGDGAHADRAHTADREHYAEV